MMSDSTYARVSSLAVISAVSGVATACSLLVTELAFVSIIGISTGYAALRAIRRYELGGAKLARFKLTHPIVRWSLTGWWSWHRGGC